MVGKDVDALPVENYDSLWHCIFIRWINMRAIPRVQWLTNYRPATAGISNEILHGLILSSTLSTYFINYMV